MRIEFVRSGGFLGRAAMVEGNVSVDADGRHVVADAAGYRRTLDAGEVSALRSGCAAVREPVETAAGDLRDGYQYDVVIVADDGRTTSVRAHGDTGGPAIVSWVRAECDKIRRFRLAGETGSG